MPEPDIARYKYILDEILRLTDDGFIVVDPQGVVTDINEQYCDFLGRTRDEVVGYPITKVIKNSKMIDIVRRRYSEELALHKYVPGDTKANDDNFVLVSRSCVFDDADQVVAGVAQVKFRLQTLDSAKRLMSEYAELEFYREEYQNYSGNQYSFEHIVGSGERFLETKRAGLKAAKTDFAVLLTGETGTGKEVFARAIHNNSPRSDKPMVSINCAAIPSELLESELFGYAEGAFTGAKKGGKKGKFQMANGGTLFLDEIGDMPLHMQAKILRVLQEGEVEPVGGSGPEPVDVRILSATRKNLTEMIQRGEFREDLYYRLNVINIEMVPLRQRRGGHPGAGQLLSGPAEQDLPPVHRPLRRGEALPDELPVAGQHPGAGQRHQGGLRHLRRLLHRHDRPARPSGQPAEGSRTGCGGLQKAGRADGQLRAGDYQVHPAGDGRQLPAGGGGTGHPSQRPV